MTTTSPSFRCLDCGRPLLGDWVLYCEECYVKRGMTIVRRLQRRYDPRRVRPAPAPRAARQ